MHGPTSKAPPHGPSGERQGKGLEDIITDKAAQAHMPAAPPVDDARDAHRREEVERQPDPDHAGTTQRHVGIAGKIKIELQQIAHRHRPGEQHAHLLTGSGCCKKRIDPQGQTVTDHDLLEQAQSQEDRADANMRADQTAIGIGFGLGRKFPVIGDRSSQDGGEK